MNESTLDALLIDRMMGELAPEVRELLDAWLESNPGCQQRQVELESVLLVARAAAASEQVSVEEQVGDEGRRLRSGWPRSVFAWAACLAAGLFIGLWWPDDNVSKNLFQERRVDLPSQEVVREISSSRLGRAENADRFWSVGNWRIAGERDGASARSWLRQPVSGARDPKEESINK